jgi:hypothetical protein
MRGGARGTEDTYMPPHETLATTSSWLNSKALAMRMVLAHPRATFHPCTCRLRRGTAAVVATVIGYDDMEVATGMTTRRRWSLLTTSSTSTRDYVGSLLQRFFRYSVCLVVMIHDLLLASILGWHGRSSASVAYPFTYSCIRTILRSSWSGSCAMVICDGY